MWRIGRIASVGRFLVIPVPYYFNILLFMHTYFYYLAEFILLSEPTLYFDSVDAYYL